MNKITPASAPLAGSRPTLRKGQAPEKSLSKTRPASNASEPELRAGAPAASKIGADQVAPQKNNSSLGVPCEPLANTQKGKGRDLLIPLAIATVAAAIGFGAFAQGGLQPSMAALIAGATFTVLFAAHKIKRRLAETARLHNQINNLQQQLKSYQGMDTGNELAPPSHSRVGRAAKARVKMPQSAPEQSGPASLVPSGKPRVQGAAALTHASMQPSSVTASTQQSSGPLLPRHLSDRTAQQRQNLPRGQAVPPRSQAPAAGSTNDGEFKQPVSPPIGAAMANAGPVATAARATQQQAKQVHHTDTRQDKAPPLPPGVRSRSKLATPPVGPDGKPIVTSVTPVPPPAAHANRPAGTPVGTIGALTGLQSNDQIGTKHSDPIASQSTKVSQRAPDQQLAPEQSVQMKPAADGTAFPMAAPSSKKLSLEAVSELLRAPGAATVATSGSEAGNEGEIARPGEQTSQQKVSLDEAFEPVSLPHLPTSESNNPEPQSHPQLSSGTTSTPNAEMSQPPVKAAIPASDAMAPSIDALRSVADEMQASQQRNGQSAAPLDKSVGAGASEAGKGPVVIAATDEHSWDDIGAATSIAQRSDAIIEAVASDRVEIFVEPILGLEDKKARHFELSARLKLLTGDRLQKCDYDDVLAQANLRSVLDVAKLANSAQLAGRLERSGKRAAVFSDYAGESLASDMFLDQLADLLNSKDNLSGYLVLSLALADVRSFGELHWDTLETLQELGFRFALEHVTDLDVDFDELKAKGFDFVKLDANVFLHGMPLDDLVVPADDLCRHLAEVGQQLIISAIEDETKLAKILGFGVLLGQGGMFGKARAVNLDISAQKSNAA